MSTDDRLSCGHDEADLVLHVMGEAEAPPHLDGCAVCTAQLAQLRVLMGGVPDSPSPDPVRAAEARGRALSAIEQRSWRARMYRWKSWRATWPAPLRWAPHLAVAILLVAIGYGLGGSRAQAPDYSVSQVAFDPGTGLFLLETAEGPLRGGLAEASVQRALAQAVREPGLRVRLHALRAVSEASPASGPVDPIVTALVEVLREQAPDPVKLRALEAIDRLYPESRFPAEVGSALLGTVTGDAGPAVRVAAIDVLLKRELSPDAIAPLGRLAENDPNWYVRLAASQAVDGPGPLERLP